MTPDETRDLLRAGRKARTARATLARVDPNAFMEFVIRDEATGAPIRQGPLHPVWHRLADAHKRLILWSHVEAGKSVNIAVGRTLWLLGRNQNLRLAIWTSTFGLANKITRTIRRYIETSVELREVFPALRPSEQQWTDSAFIVDRTVTSRDPSVQAIATHQRSVLGARLDGVIGDDVLDFENTRTAEGRQDVYDWVHSTLLGRLVADAFITIIGNAWHPEDLLHRLARSPGWHARKFPIQDRDGNSTWPAAWSVARIAHKRQELGPVEADRQLDCRPFSDKTALFKAAYFVAAKARGKGRRIRESLRLDDYPAGTGLYTGVDVAGSDNPGADESAIVSTLVHPDLRREVVFAKGGQWRGPTLLDELISHLQNFPDQILMVESNAVQVWMIQFIRQRATEIGFIPYVLPFHTGRNKHDPAFGFESLSVEFYADEWTMPAPDGITGEPAIEKLCMQLQHYKRGAHVGDYAFATWLSRECARRWGKRGRPVRRPLPGAAPPAQADAKTDPRPLRARGLLR